MNSLKQTLISKLRRPVHISFISKHLTRTSMEETERIISELIEDGILEESKYGKGYYVVKSK
jgi:hypothetical protein